MAAPVAAPCAAATKSLSQELRGSSAPPSETEQSTAGHSSELDELVSQWQRHTVVTGSASGGAETQPARSTPERNTPTAPQRASADQDAALKLMKP